MPRAIVNPGPRLETLPSYSDPSIPLVSIHSPWRRPIPDTDYPSDSDAIPTEPRPRPSLQIYYTSPLTTTAPAEELETVARTPVAEWAWASKEKTGRGLVLSTVMFDPTKDGPDPVPGVFGFDRARDVGAIP